MGQADQYSRRNNIIIKGTSTDTAKDDLENEVLEILGKIDVIVSSIDIEATHRIGKKRQNTIVRFILCKNVSKAIANRRKLKGHNIYIEENFCPFVSKIGYMARKLCRARMVYSMWIVNGAIAVKFKEKDKEVQIIEHPNTPIRQFVTALVLES